jgi:hypothetical protein
MKKSIVAGLIALALIVLVSPGLVGYLAERSLDSQVEWAADENREIEIRSGGFERGWFSSEGSHRIEFARTAAGLELRDALGFEGDGQGPAILIDTRLDHGLVPVSSMQGERGSLMPGLGRAESRISIEAADGTVTELPGLVYTTIGLTGAVSSRYALEPGATDAVSWGRTDVSVDSNARTGRLAAKALASALEVRSFGSTFAASGITFESDTVRTPYDFHVGDVDLSVESVTHTGAGPALSFGPLHLRSESGLNDDAVDSRFFVDLKYDELPEVGPLTWSLEGSLAGLDAAALGRIVDGLEDARDAADPGLMFDAVEADLMALLARGLEAHIERFDVGLAEGTFEADMDIAVAETEPADFVWTGLLLSTQAQANIVIPAPLFEQIASRIPDARALVALGFLVPNGGAYELKAEFAQGLLTINGAPQPIPIPSM